MLVKIFKLQPPWWDFYYAKTWWNVYAWRVNTCSNTNCSKEVVVFDLLLVTTLQSTDNKITISYIKQIINPMLHWYIFSCLYWCIFSSFTRIPIQSFTFMHIQSFTLMHIQFIYMYAYSVRFHLYILFRYHLNRL
jgi:hypothetical protein